MWGPKELGGWSGIVIIFTRTVTERGPGRSEKTEKLYKPLHRGQPVPSVDGPQCPNIFVAVELMRGFAEKVSSVPTACKSSSAIWVLELSVANNKNNRIHGHLQRELYHRQTELYGDISRKPSKVFPFKLEASFCVALYVNSFCNNYWEYPYNKVIRLQWF